MRATQTGAAPGKAAGTVLDYALRDVCRYYADEPDNKALDAIVFADSPAERAAAFRAIPDTYRAASIFIDEVASDPEKHITAATQEGR